MQVEHYKGAEDLLGIVSDHPGAGLDSRRPRDVTVELQEIPHGLVEAAEDEGWTSFVLPYLCFLFPLLSRPPFSQPPTATTHHLHRHRPLSPVGDGEGVQQAPEGADVDVDEDGHGLHLMVDAVMVEEAHVVT